MAKKKDELRCPDCGHHLHRPTPGPCQWRDCACGRVDPEARDEIIDLGQARPEDVPRLADLNPLQTTSAITELPTQSPPAPLTMHRIRIWVRDADDRKEARSVYYIAARSGRDALDEAIARFRREVVIDSDTERLDPILIERLGENLTKVTDGGFDGWWGKVFVRARTGLERVLNRGTDD